MNINDYISLLFVPAIIISAVLSVLMADMHREIKGKVSYFERKIDDRLGAFIDRCIEFVLSFLFALFVIILIVTIIGALVKIIQIIIVKL